MLTLSQNLTLSRCPHCSVATPNLSQQAALMTNNHTETNRRVWIFYACGNCGGVVTASATAMGAEVLEYFPSSLVIDEDVPERARAYLQQALESLHAPAGAVMLAASSVDSMLKIKGYTEGSLYARIEKAASDHLITQEMAKWAHEVRLDANDQRHADEAASLPTTAEAKRVLDFANALADFLFVLPNRVQRGMDGR